MGCRGLCDRCSPLRLALGFGEGAAFPTATRAMAVGLPESSWGFAQGITHSSARIGNAVTPPLMALLVGLVSWRGSFVVLGAPEPDLALGLAAGTFAMIRATSRR